MNRVERHNRFRVAINFMLLRSSLVSAVAAAAAAVKVLSHSSEKF
jgi:hypothetical protein